MLKKSKQFKLNPAFLQWKEDTKLIKVRYLRKKKLTAKVLKILK